MLRPQHLPCRASDGEHDLAADAAAFTEFVRLGRVFQPPRVDYAMTELGSQVADLFNTLGEWAEEHVHEILAARKAFDERPEAGPVP